MKKVTGRVADFTGKTRWEDLPIRVRHEVKRLFLDSVGCALGGLGTPKGKLAVKLARRLGGTPEARILGMGDRLAGPQAAFANGELMNALDYDAIIAASHIPPFVIPAILAVAEKERASGKDLILALAVGLELTTRIVKATTGLMEVMREGGSQVSFKLPMVHGYSTGIFGAVAGAGRVAKLDREKLLHALGIGGAITPMKSMPKWYNSPPAALTKYTMAGWVSQAAVTALYLARMGYTGVRDILDGEDGYWKFSGSQKWEPEKITADLGKKWIFLDIDYKPYPCCRAMHGGLDCFCQILEENGLKPEEVKRVNLLLHPLAEKPIWRSSKIENHVAAQFSVAYVFAAAAHRVSLDRWQDDQTMKNPAILRFMSKVHWTPHPTFNEELLQDPHCRPVAIEVVTRDGRSIKREARYLKGASWPSGFGLTDEELVRKFKGNAARCFPPSKIEDSIERIFQMEKIRRIDTLMDSLTLPLPSGEG